MKVRYHWVPVVVRKWYNQRGQFQMATVTNNIIPSRDVQHETWQAPVVDGPIMGKNGGLSSKPPTAAQLQSLQNDAWKQAYQEGLEKGREKGHQEGLARSQQEIAKELAVIGDLIAHLAEPVSELDEQVQSLIVKLAVQIARQLVRREFRQEPGEIIAVVREALAVLPLSSSKPKIYLHPEDAELVRNALSISDSDAKWELHEDLLLTRGDCRVETDSSLVDATLDNKLSSIAAKLLGGERGSDL